MHKPKKWLFPAAVARDYEKALRRVASATVRETEKLLARRQDDDEWYADWNRVLMDLPRQLELPLREAGIAVRLAAEQTDRFNGRQFREVVRSAYGADIVKPDPDTAAALQNWTAANAALIKSIPEKYAAKVQNLVMQAAVNGTSQADLIRQIRQTYQLPHDHARLIANDQIGKLNGQLARMRQQNIGITHYRWRGTLDARERDSHLRREGKMFAWDKPPSDGHPGNAVRCRCHAEPIFPELADLDAALFGAGGDNRHYHAEMTRRGLKPEAGMPDLAANPFAEYGFVPRGTDVVPDFEAMGADLPPHVKKMVAQTLREMPYHPTAAAFALEYGLTVAEQSALYVYTRLGKRMNLNEYAPEKMPPDEAALWQFLSPLVDAALDKLPDYVGEVRRGMKWDAAFLTAHATGAEVVYPNFVSASVGEVGFGHLPVQLLIRSKHGKLIEPISATAAQREVLFKRQSRFRVLGVVQLGAQWFVHLEQL